MSKSSQRHLNRRRKRIWTHVCRSFRVPGGEIWEMGRPWDVRHPKVSWVGWVFAARWHLRIREIHPKNDKYTSDWWNDRWIWRCAIKQHRVRLGNELCFGERIEFRTTIHTTTTMKTPLQAHDDFWKSHWVQFAALVFCKCFLSAQGISRSTTDFTAKSPWIRSAKAAKWKQSPPKLGILSGELHQLGWISFWELYRYTIGSGIYLRIYHSNQPNVGEYTLGKNLGRNVICKHQWYFSQTSGLNLKPFQFRSFCPNWSFSRCGSLSRNAWRRMSSSIETSLGGEGLKVVFFFY